MAYSGGYAEGYEDTSSEARIAQVSGQVLRQGDSDVRAAQVSGQAVTHGDSSDVRATQVSGQVITKGPVSIPWSTDGYNGLINWLGTNKDTDTFANPDTVRGFVDTTQVSNQSGDLTADKALDQATGIATNRSHTTNLHGAWWQIDFGAGNSVSASRIGIIGQDYSANQPRYFHIQGSADGAVWSELLNSTTAIGRNAWTSWAISDTTRYRFFRIRFTRRRGDSSNNDYMILGDVEFWGDYYEQPALTPSTVFPASPGFGWSGLFEWLGQNKSASLWQHPETSRALVVTSMSSTFSGQISSNAIDHSWSDTGAHTENVAGSWWKVDLGAGNLFRLDTVALYGRSASNPRNFRIEGSLDDSVWDELYDVPDGSTGPTDDVWSGYDMDVNTTAYRYFRLTQYGLNSSSLNWLAINSIEFYGESLEESFGVSVAGSGDTTSGGSGELSYTASGAGVGAVAAVGWATLTIDSAVVGETWGYIPI